MIPSLSVIVPVYDEEPTLARTVRTADAMLRSHIVERLEWVLVDDGSTDGTWSEITSLARSISDVISFRHDTNRGLGAAIWTGMAQASSEWCTWLPADGQVEPQAIADMVRLANEADLVLAMREMDTRAWWRRVLTLALYGVMRTLLGFDPYGYSGVFLVRRQILHGIPLASTTGMQNCVVALHCRKNGCRIRQTRMVIQPRISGRSKVANFPTMFKTLLDIFRLRFIL